MEHLILWLGIINYWGTSETFGVDFDDQKFYRCALSRRV